MLQIEPVDVINPLAGEEIASTEYGPVHRLVLVGQRDAGFSLEHLCLALEATRLGYWQVDLQTWDLISSPQCKAKYGCSPDQEFTLEMFFRCVHPEDRQKLREAFEAAEQKARDGDPNFSVEYRAYWADGQLRWNLSTGIALMDPQGNPRYLVGVTLDITERKQLEAALAERERHYRQLLAAMSDMLVRLDREGRCLEFKPAGRLPTLGGSETYVGKTLEELFCSAEAQTLREGLELAFATHQVQEVEYPSQARYRQARFVPFGEMQMLVVVSDITTRKQAELKLQKQVQREQLFNQLIRALNTTLDLAALFDVAVREVGQVLQSVRVTLYQYLPAQTLWVGIAEYRASDHLPTTLGRRIADSDLPELVRGLKALQVFHVQDPGQIHLPLVVQEKQEHQLGPWLVIPVAHHGEMWGGLVLRRLVSDPDYEPDEIELAKGIGNYLAVAIQQAELYQQLRQTNAELDYQIRVHNAQLQQAYSDQALLQLITEEIRASLDEQKILETVAQELTLTLQLSDCAIHLYDFQRRVSSLRVHYSPEQESRSFRSEIPLAELGNVFGQLREGQLCHFCGCHNPCWPNHSCHTLLAVPIDSPQDPAQPGQEAWVLGDILLVRPPEQVFSEREQRLVREVASQCAVAIRQARLYQTVRQQVQQLEELHRLKDDFLHMVSHELRTPLTNIKLAVSFLRQANLSEREQRYLYILETETNRELELINDLLELQAIEAGSRELKVSVLLPQEWFTEVTEPFALRAREQSQQFEVGLDPGLAPLSTDKSLLTRVVTELLNNACKYTPAGETIRLEARQDRRGSRSGWWITLRNTGVEIPPEALSRLFEKFYRVTLLDRRNMGGTGLGLPLAQKAMELLQGSLTVESHSQEVIFQVWCPDHAGLANLGEGGDPLPGRAKRLAQDSNLQPST